MTVHYVCVTLWIISGTLLSDSSAAWGWMHHTEREPQRRWIERSGRVEDKNGAKDVSERAREREEALLACLMCEFDCGESKWHCSVCGHRETRSFNSPTSPDWLYHSNSLLFLSYCPSSPLFICTPQFSVCFRLDTSCFVKS